ncbi:glucan biosynthesis protein [Tepidamorphus sp. 3E244]|uniref:glucan biosynthesis protein n=1 Tax=Tepidamorphus sp. 3E244 TaxID=3385498 RepID=UPI0038FC20F7
MSHSAARVLSHLLLLSLLVLPFDSARNAANAAEGEALFDMVKQKAEALAAADYVAPQEVDVAGLPQGYDEYRRVTYDRERALWQSSPTGFQVQFLPAGWLFKHAVDIWAVEDGEPSQIALGPDDFVDGRSTAEGRLDMVEQSIPLSGFRINWPLNEEGKADEVIVFQGASYFRALARGQHYGLSARALAIDTASPSGEEFPEFREFWLVQPREGDTSITIYALLDSPSAAGAYRFTVTPGAVTLVDVDSMVYPRREIANFGIAPLTSMFLVGPIAPRRADDFRPEIHDSDGLAILNGSNERIWRPLANPRTLQISSFMDAGVKGFGLMQRERRFPRYEDLEARYDLRPSTWVEAGEGFQDGNVVLVEIPTDLEIHDNIVSYWQPAQPLVPGTPRRFAYTLQWRKHAPTQEMGPHVMWTRAGGVPAAGDEEIYRFIIDYSPAASGDPATMRQAEVTTSKGTVRHVSVQDNEVTGGLRVTFEFLPEGAKVAELRATLPSSPDIPAENWLYRWTPTR